MGTGGVVLSLSDLFTQVAHNPVLGLTCLLVLAVVAGIPVVAEYAATGLVPRIPTMLGSLALAGCGALSFVTGLILDTVAKSHRRQWEIDVYKAMNGFYRE